MCLIFYLTTDMFYDIIHIIEGEYAMDMSKIRQKVYQLDKERSKLLSKVLRPGKMVRGSLYQMWRGCGNPNCKCARGEKHVSWYLSQQIEWKTKLTYIGRIVPAWIEELVHRYQHHQKVLAQIRKIDTEISKSLNELRDTMVKTIEDVRKEKH